MAADVANDDCRDPEKKKFDAHRRPTDPVYPVRLGNGPRPNSSAAALTVSGNDGLARANRFFPRRPVRPHTVGCFRAAAGGGWRRPAEREGRGWGATASRGGGGGSNVSKTAGTKKPDRRRHRRRRDRDPGQSADGRRKYITAVRPFRRRHCVPNLRLSRTYEYSDDDDVCPTDDITTVNDASLDTRKGIIISRPFNYLRCRYYFSAPKRSRQSVSVVASPFRNAVVKPKNSVPVAYYWPALRSPSADDPRFFPSLTTR